MRRLSVTILLMLLPVSAMGAVTRYQIQADTTTIMAGDLLQGLGKADLDSAIIDTLFGMKLFLGTRPVTIFPTFSLGMSAGYQARLPYLDADTLAGAVRLTGAATLAGGGTLPAGQTLTGSAGSIIDVTAITPDSILGSTRLTGAATLAGGATVPAGVTITGSAGSIFDLTAVTPDSILGNVKVTGTPVFSSGFSALLANINSGTIDGATIGGVTAGAGTFTTLTASGVLSANDTLDISTAAKWQLANVSYTGTMANLNTLRDDSMVDALHRHSELSASDGTPDAALTLTAIGDVSIGATRLFIGTTTASTFAVGPSLLIDQGANDDNAIELQSTDVAHGMTTNVSTSAFATLYKADINYGGVVLAGYTEGTKGLGINGAVTNVVTAKTTSGWGAVEVTALLKTGTTIGAMSANGNLFSVVNYDAVQFIVDAEGDLFANGSDVTVYDEYDDVRMVRALDLATNSDRLIRSQWDEYVAYNEADLVKAGILGAPRSEGGLVCVTQLQRLHNGAIWQSAQHIYELEEWRETDVDPRLTYLERRLNGVQMQLAWRELMHTVEGM